jgi:DNA-binding response OmpR family regulator
VDHDPAVRQDIEAYLTHRGYEALAVTNGEKRSRTGHLVCSAAPTIDGAVHYLPYGALDYLLKPVNPARLEASLQRVLRPRVELIRQRDMSRLLKDLTGSVLTPEAHQVLRAMVEGGAARAFVADEHIKDWNR